MANIFFNPVSPLSLPSSEAQDFSVEATYSFAGDTPSVQDDWQISEVSTPEGVTQNSRTLLESSSEQQVYAYSFHTDANDSRFERMIGLQFSALRIGDDGVLKLYQVSQPGQSTPVTHPSLSLSPAQVRFLSSEVSVASVTASMYNTGSTLSLTPSSPSWVTVNPVDSYQQGDAYVKTYLLTASANPSATSRDSFVSFSLNTAGETVVDSVSVTQPGRASVVEPIVTLSTYLYELESEGANVGIVAYVSGTVASNVSVTGDHTPTVEYTTTNNVVTASIQFSVPANTSAVTRSTYMTVSAWNSAGTSSKVLEIRTAGTDEPTPLPEGNVLIVSGNYITASANANSTSFTVRYVNCISGEYTIDGAGGFSGMDNPVSQSTVQDGNDVVVIYTAAFPNNLTAEAVTRRASFQMHRGEGATFEQKTALAEIHQEGVYAPGGAGVIIQNTPVSVAANVTQSTFYVTYSNALQDSWVIQSPSFSLGAYLISSTSQDSGQDTIRSYTVGYPANQTTNPVTHSAFFKMSYGQYHDEDTGYIYQAAASPSPSTYSISCSWDYYDAGALQQITRTIRVRYDGGQYPDDFVGNPITSSNITALSATPIPSSDPAYCEINYSITAVNTGQNATVTFNIPGAGVTKTATIHFSGAPDPSSPDIVVPGSPFNLASGDQIVTFTAIYKNSYPGWTVRTANTNKSDMHIVSSSVQIVGSDQQVTYEVTFPGNAGDLPVDRRVFLEMTSGSGVAENERKTGQAIIYQAGRLQVGSIHLQPSRAWVAYSDTQSTFFATYSFSGLAYEIQNPVGNQCSVTTVNTRTLENGDQVYQYRVTFPTNPSTNTPVSRSVDCRMTTGSITAIETYIVAQDYQGGGGSKQILVNPTSKWLQANEITATTQVTYMGYSSAAQVSTPSCPSGWTATVGNVQESSGQVTINWIFTGTPNTGTGTKTNTFTIGATGATSKTFTIFQYGTGGGGGSETTYVSPVWEKHEVSSSLPSDTLVVTSGSWVIFNDRVYASPEGTLKVDLNRICELFVVSDDLPYPYAKDERGDGWVVGGGLRRSFNIPHFTATLQSTGKTYEGYILRDWSYRDPAKTEGVVSSTGIIPMAAGQPFMGTIVNATTSDYSYEATDEDGTATGTVAGRTYADIGWSTGNLCGPFTLYYPHTGETRQGMVTSNSKWVVYFRNKRNGIEWIVLDGPVVPMVEVTRNNYLQGVVRYTKSYLNKVVNRWKCSTGIMSDQWSYLVSEMIESTQVGLLDLNTFTMWQVRPITNTVEQKTFWNQGRKFATYQFDLEHVLNQARR